MLYLGLIIFHNLSTEAEKSFKETCDPGTAEALIPMWGKKLKEFSKIILAKKNKNVHMLLSHKHR